MVSHQQPQTSTLVPLNMHLMWRNVFGEEFDSQIGSHQGMAVPINSHQTGEIPAAIGSICCLK